MPEFRISCPQGHTWTRKEGRPDGETLRCPRCYETYPMEEFGFKLLVKKIPAPTKRSESIKFDCPKGLHGTRTGLHLGNNDFICPGCYTDAVSTFQGATRPAIRHVDSGTKQMFIAAGISDDPPVPPNHTIDVPISTKERRAIGIMASELARRSREDLIGAIMISGAFHELADADMAVVNLSYKLEAFLPKDHRFHRMVTGGQVEGRTRDTEIVRNLKRDKARLLSERHGNGSLTCQVCGCFEDDETLIYLESAEMFLCPQCVEETEETDGGAAGICGQCRVQGDVPLTHCKDTDQFLCAACLEKTKES